MSKVRSAAVPDPSHDKSKTHPAGGSRPPNNLRTDYVGARVGIAGGPEPLGRGARATRLSGVAAVAWTEQPRRRVVPLLSWGLNGVASCCEFRFEGAVGGFAGLVTRSIALVWFGLDEGRTSTSSGCIDAAGESGSTLRQTQSSHRSTTRNFDLSGITRRETASYVSVGRAGQQLLKPLGGRTYEA
jgi:hypothetical protein